MDKEDCGSVIYPDPEPRQAKGGVFAPSDIDLIKRALLVFVHNTSDPISVGEEKQIVNLLHRLNRL